LIEEALAHRSEEMTATQFQLVENRLAYMEKRFSAWMAKLARGIGTAWFYSEQLATFELEDDEKRVVNEDALKFVREFMKVKTEFEQKPDGGA
jgi:hypothetical protein